MSSSSVEKITGLSGFQVRVYFKWDTLKKAATWTLIVGLVIAALGFYISEASVILIGSALILLGIAIFYFFGKKLPSDAQIDEAWEKLAASRENEGYRVGNFKRSDAIRDSEHFLLCLNNLAILNIVKDTAQMMGLLEEIISTS